MHYAKRDEKVEAVQYKSGMEDGFDKAFDSDRKKDVIMPYILRGKGLRVERAFLQEGDYIVTNIEGRERYVVSKDVFEELFEPIVTTIYGIYSDEPNSGIRKICTSEEKAKKIVRDWNTIKGFDVDEPVTYSYKPIDLAEEK